MQTKASLLTRTFVALLLLPACSIGVDDREPGTDGGITTSGSGGTGGSYAGGGGTPGSGGGVGTGGNGAGTGGGSGTVGGSVSTGGAGGGGAVQGGTAGTGGAGGSDAEPMGGAPQVTPSMATSVPATYGSAVAKPGKLTLKVMYPVYYYSTTATSEEAFKSTPTIPKQNTPIMKPLNVYTPPDYDLQKQYPLILIMHGITDNENTWNERSSPNVATLFDNLITSKTTQPFIAVFAWGTSVERDNTPGYYAFGAELTNDLLPFLEANYPVKKDRGSRAMAGFSFGGMQTVNIGLCAHLKEFAWFAGLDAAGGVADATKIANYVEMQNPQMYPLYYFYLSAGSNDDGAKDALAASSDGLTTKGPYITSANFSSQDNITGPQNGGHNYPTAEVGLYNFLRMAFAPN
jgi:hypothetical protein